MQTKAFMIEEDNGSHKAIKDDISKAVYSGKFKEYIIAKSHLLEDTLIVTDMISERDKVDIINRFIKELVFNDCVRNFDEIWNEASLNKNFKFEVIEEPVNDSCVYKFKEDIKILDSTVRSVKIFINGYDESSESVYLDLQMLDEKSVYKYKITSDTIEISIITDMKSSKISELLKTFVYTKMSLDAKRVREIYVIINDKLSHKFNIEI